MKRLLLGALAAACLAASTQVASQAADIDWVDWTAVASGQQVTGTLAAGSVHVTFTGEFAFAQLGSGTNYWTEPNAADRPYTNNAVVANAPTASELIALDRAGSYRVAFDKAVLNPLVAFISWDSRISGIGQDMTFTGIAPNSVQLLSEGEGYWGNGTCQAAPNGLDVVSGECHGVLQLSGVYTEISFTDTVSENWHGLTIGIEGVNAASEPATVGLVGLALLGIGLATGRRKRR